MQDRNLDDAAQSALTVALETAGAIGDDQCGTEYLLYGIMATATGDTAELADLFALDALRIERGIHVLRAHRFSLEHDGVGPTPLTDRANRALRTPRADDAEGSTGVFEILHGLLEDESSGACQVLRELGVRPTEMRRLVAYGTRHMTKEELDELLETLDRRTADHRPWWGPRPGETLETLNFPDQGGAVQLAASESAVARLPTVAVTPEGFGLTVTIESLRPWLLPPVLQPVEVLVPGQAPELVDGPELFSLELHFSDGTFVSNRSIWPRWTQDRPDRPVLVSVGTRTEIVDMNDRRRSEHRLVTSDWWVWPLPPEGPIELRVSWSAESLFGSASFDGRPMLAALHSGDR